MAFQISVDEGSVNLGKQILRAFHEEALEFTSYSLTFEQLLAFYQPKTNTMLEGLGDNLKLQGITLKEAQNFMVRFANDIQGKIPDKKDWLAFHFAITKYLTNPTWWKTIKTVSADTAIDIGEGIVEHGGQALAILKAYNKFLPLLAAGAGILILMRIKGSRRKLP